VDEGVLERHATTESGKRARYFLTPAGRDLSHVLIALIEWGNRWRPLPNGPATVLVHECGKRTKPVLVCDRCGEPVTPDTIRMEPAPSRRHDETHPLVRAAAARSH